MSERPFVRPRYYVAGDRHAAGTLRIVDELERILEDPGAALADPAPEHRRLALSMLAGSTAHFDAIQAALDDPVPRVRSEAAEALGAMGAVAAEALHARTEIETDEIVVEALAAALGELEETAAVPWLLTIATGTHETLTRETAVASLGAIGDERALPTLLQLVAKAPPQVRRRCVVALTVFDGDDVEAAIRAAVRDRNPMVREAAEMAVGRPVDEWIGLDFRRDSASERDVDLAE